MKTFDITYKTFDPTGNRTMLVTSSVSREDQPMAAAGIMEQHRELEQIAFVEGEGDSRRLQMMGGEFCGNATMSFAAMLAMEAGVESAEMEVEVSGSDEKIPVTVEKDGDGWNGKVSMPLPEKCKVRNFGRYKLPVVKFDGISHTIVTERMPKPLAEMMIREWANKVRADAFGILLMSKDYREMTPLVYVKSTDTVVAESSCASGTAAVGAWLAVEKKEPVNLTIRQPGGELSIEVEVTDGNVSKLLLGGHVSCVEEGQMQAEEKVFHLKHD